MEDIGLLTEKEKRQVNQIKETIAAYFKEFRKTNPPKAKY